MREKDRLIEGNKNYVASIKNNEAKTKLAKDLISHQSPYALVITCSDSRVIPEEIFSCSLGELFVIRTAGNAVNEGELASIEYGIEHLNIKYVLVLGHTHCGAVHAAMHNEKGRFLDPVLDKIHAAINCLEDEVEASKANALFQANYIKSLFPEFDGKIESALYDIETNEVIFIEN